MNNRFQRFLWHVAGAETDILEKCRTDYKRYAAIGATILMTSFIAFCAGTAAAWYFSQSGEHPSGHLGWALCFGAIWSLLIFCIDRSLVITLKKDPTVKKQKFWVPLLFRAVLAMIIAFMVSIPLELVIFEDYIKSNEENFLAYQTSLLGEQIKANSGEDATIARIDSASTAVSVYNRQSEALGAQISSLQQQINRLEVEKNNPNSQAYNSAKSRYNNAQTAYNNARSRYNAERSKQNPSSSAISSYQSQMNSQRSNMNSARNDMNAAATQWRQQKQNEINNLIAQRDGKQADKDQKDRLLDQVVTGQAQDRETARQDAERRREREQIKENQLKNGNHFIQNFQILEYAVWQRDKDGNLTDKTQLLFLWLIRLLFFILEILPTVVKIVTPLGSYDRMVYAEEENMKTYLNSDEYMDRLKHMHDLEVEAKEEQLRKQHDAELAIKDELLTNLKDAQLEVARKAIENWKNQELNKLKGTTDASGSPSSTHSVPSTHVSPAHSAHPVTVTPPPAISSVPPVPSSLLPIEPLTLDEETSTEGPIGPMV